jgi:HSP20 family protein
MTLFGKEIPGSLTDLQTGINRLFEQVWHGGIRTGPFDGQDCAPPVDVIEKNDRYVVEMELPGAAREDIDVSCTATQLTVRGQKVHSPAREESDQPIIAERRCGGFSRIVPFAEAVKADEMSAKLENGLLRIVAPKKTITTSQAVNIAIEE